MPDPITVDKKSEFFITLGKEGIHSFIMLGVMVNEKPTPLARVGKGNLIDQNFGMSLKNQLTMLKKNLVNHTDASLVDEGLTAGHDISYQAYSITYEQYQEFLVLTKEIHDHQLEHYKDRIVEHQDDAEYEDLPYPEKGVRKLTNGIRCYIPAHEESGKITFQYQKLNTYTKTPKSPTSAASTRQELIDGANSLHVSNTCRTTARSLVNYILGYTPQIPTLFAIGLNYKTELVGGVPTANTFYILPVPPKAFDVNPAQMKALEELYKRLENVPKTDPSSPTTKAKFDALKKLYKELSGEPTLPLVELLDKVTLHRTEHNALFDAHRGKGLVTDFLKAVGMKTGTQKAFDRMEAEIKKEIKRVKKVEADEDEYQSDERRPPTVSM